MVYDTVCVYVMSFPHCNSFNVLTKGTAISLKLCHLKDKNISQSPVLTEILDWGKDMKDIKEGWRGWRIKVRKKWFHIEFWWT